MNSPSFSLITTNDLKRLWLRGGFPKSYLADTLQESNDWRKFYIATFLEKDIPNLGIHVPPQTLRRFWMMLTHYHGNIFNASEIGRSLGVSHTTIKNYLNILSGAFMIRQLNPWTENIKKRQVKSPKIYFRDSGILHSLMGLESMEALKNSPKLGASWEGVALEEIIRCHEADPEDCYFWATHMGAELDLLIVKNGKRLGFEFKYADAPKFTKSMQAALEDLHLDQLTVIYAGEGDFPLKHNVRALGLQTYIEKYTPSAKHN